jgi:hypothetical protein
MRRETRSSRDAGALPGGSSETDSRKNPTSITEIRTKPDIAELDNLVASRRMRILHFDDGFISGTTSRSLIPPGSEDVNRRSDLRKLAIFNLVNQIITKPNRIVVAKNTGNYRPMRFVGCS